MNPRRKPSLAMLALISTLATMPVQALRPESRLLAQAPAEPPPTFTLQDSVAPDTTITIDGSPSMAGINQSLKESFEQRYPGSSVVVSTSSDEQALQALMAGTIDLAALGRALSAAEEDPTLTSVPVTREKIAIIVGRDNPFQGDLTFGNFAAIFRGEITNWAQLGGPNVPIRFIDRPATSDTRLALADYQIFEGKPFQTGATAVQVSEDDTAAVVRELGNDGISYAVVSEVANQDAVRPLSMHNTLPDDPRYPYSQPRNYIYRGEASLPIEAFLGFATNADGQVAVEAAKQSANANVTVGANRLPGGVTLSPDGRFMVRGTEDGQLQWLDAQGNPTATVVTNAHRGAVAAVVISPDGQTVVSSGADGTIRRWDRNGVPLGEAIAGRGGPILSLAISPDGQTLASGNANGTVERWAMANGASLGEPTQAHPGPVQAIHFPAGGQSFLTGSSDGTLRFWNPDGTPAGQIDNAHGGGITAITSTPDGQVITTAGGDGTLRQWDRSTLQPRGNAIQAHGNSVSAVAYAPDGRTLATAGDDSTLQLWGVDGVPKLPAPLQLSAPAASLGYTPEGQLVVGSSNNTVELRNSQGELGDAGAQPMAPATDLTALLERIKRLPPSTWWMLAVIPALLMLAGLVGSMLGIKGRDRDQTLEADLGPGLGGADFSGLGRPSVGPMPGGEYLPPEAGLVPSTGEYSGSAAPNKLEQARIDLAEGRRLMREGRYDSALIYFNSAVEATEIERLKADATGIPAQGVNAIAAQAQAQRGNALALQGQANEAMDSYNAALQLDASVTEAWIGKGRLLSTMGRYEEAIFCFDSALEIDQSAGDAWLGKGQALAQLGRQTEAEACLARATALGSSDSGPTGPGGYFEGSGAGITPGPEGLSEYPYSPGPGYDSGYDSGYDPDIPLELQQLVNPGIVAPEYPYSPSPSPEPSPGYDPDIPLELQQLVDPGTLAPEYPYAPSPEPSPGYDPDIPLELQQLVNPGAVAPEYPYAPSPSPGYDPDIPPELQELVNPGAVAPEYPYSLGPDPSPSPGYDPDIPPELQQMVLGLPSEDANLESLPSPDSYDIPPELAAEAARLPNRAEAAGLGLLGRPAGSLSITPGPTPPAAITPGPVPPSSLEEELLSQVHLTTETMPLPNPVPAPAPVPLEPGDYVAPPPETTTAGMSGLEGLPPEVLAALASIPPSSSDSFGAVPASANSVATVPAPASTQSWIRLSVDRESDRFYAVWQIDAGDRAQAKAQGGVTLALRLYDVTGHSTQTPLPPAVAEQRCRDDFSQDWYLPLPQWDRIYVATVGYLSATGTWQAIAQSTEVAAIKA